MKKLILSLAVMAAALVSNAALETISIPTDSSYTSHQPGKVVQVRVLSTVPDGTVTLKAASTLTGAFDDVRTTYATNVTYSLVYSNGTDIVTNTVAVDYSPFPTNMSYISYGTNTLVTSTTTTNVFYGAALVVTNAMGDAITCSGGFGSSNPSNKTICPGDRLFWSGTARGTVTVIVER